jgi:hypothetical protein
VVAIVIDTRILSADYSEIANCRPSGAGWKPFRRAMVPTSFKAPENRTVWGLRGTAGLDRILAQDGDEDPDQRKEPEGINPRTTLIGAHEEQLADALGREARSLTGRPCRNPKAKNHEYKKSNPQRPDSLSYLATSSMASTGSNSLIGLPSGSSI